jgi:hypothetical protein
MQVFSKTRLETTLSIQKPPIFFYINTGTGFELGGQAFTAFGATGTHNFAAGFCGHTGTKTMGAGTT